MEINKYPNNEFKEIVQEKYLLENISEQLEKNTNKLSIENEQLKNHINKDHFTIKELSQEKIISEEYGKILKLKSLRTKKILLGISLMLTVAISFIFFGGMVEPTENATPLKSKFVIENLRGDKVYTFMRWQILPQDTLVVNIINPEFASSEQVQKIKDVITSTESLDIDDSLQHMGPKGTLSTYYRGWQGALDYLSSKDTKYNIPKEINVIESKNGEGQIIINLSNEVNSDGYSGFTKSIVDQNQILKSTITIYDMNELSSVQLETIVRHEFGHALGLAHSTAPNDLMYPIILTDYPYISQCDLDAIVALYDGKESSDVICQK